MAPRPVALVTGSSVGIGRATALALARDGFDVAFHYLSHEKEAKDAAARAKKRFDAATTAVKADVSRWTDVAYLFTQVEEDLGPVHALVANAGVYPRMPLEKVSPEEWRRVLDTNLSSVHYCCYRAAPAMKEKKRGAIVALSSILGTRGSQHGVHYAASKAGIQGYTKSLARELAPFGIPVNAVAPGAIETAILSEDSEAQREARLKTIPMGRVGTAEEIAETIAFLCGPKARYITGQVIHVNGGLLMP